jgi:ABC-2 type transport system ATP-binding protein
MPEAAVTGDSVVVRGLRKQYGKTTAVNGLDLEIHAGEVFCLLGPNGAGKTTTIEILEGLRDRTGGVVLVLGRDPAEHRREWRARIGVVPQSTGAFADLTVREVVAQFAAFYPAPLPADEVINMVGLSAQRGKRAISLSGGQRRRLDVAVGLVGDPELVFLDEPTTGLDPVARREAWDLVRFLSGRGTTTVLTTHYLEEAEVLADRVGVIIGGRMVDMGPPADLGGRSRIPAKVSFAKTGALAGLSLPPLPPDTQVETYADHEVCMVASHPTAVMDALLRWAHASDVREIPGLSIHRPTLEEIYLDLIRKHGQGRMDLVDPVDQVGQVDQTEASLS